MSHIDLWEPCCSAKVPDDPQTYTLDVLWLQEKGAQIQMSVLSQSFTFTKNVERGFILCSTPPTQCDSPISSRSLLRVLCPGPCPIKGQKPILGTQTRSRN